MRIALTPLGKSTSIIAGTALVIALTYAAGALGRRDRQEQPMQIAPVSIAPEAQRTRRDARDLGGGLKLTGYPEREIWVAPPPRRFVNGRYVDDEEANGR